VCPRRGQGEAYGDELCKALRWAINVAEGYAAAEGITLARLDDEATAEPAEDAP
jgi:hypothetical protein